MKCNKFRQKKKALLQNLHPIMLTPKPASKKCMPEIRLELGKEHKLNVYDESNSQPSHRKRRSFAF